MIEACVIADSVTPYSLTRLTTFELTMPKCLLAQFNTHGMVRRNAESSRARPTKAILQQLNEDPYLPPVWNYRQRGMQPAGPMDYVDSQCMKHLEWRLRKFTMATVLEMEKLKAAKEDINRYLEPWMYCKVVASSTNWENYWKLRAHGPEAQAAHGMLARAMLAAYEASTPIEREPRSYKIREALDYTSDWHLPYVTDQERTEQPANILTQMSAARCGRVSYARQGQIKSPEEDVERVSQWVRDGHWSALEGPAQAQLHDTSWFGPFQGWWSLRKMYAGESGSTRHGTQKDVEPWAIRSTIPSITTPTLQE